MRGVQVAVVGGGPAGLSAAAAAAHAGAHVLLLDENRALGGQLRYRLTDLPDLAETLIAEARDAEADLRTAAVAWGLFSGPMLAVSEPQDAYHLRADHVILATGSTDLPFTFPGGSLPGVLTSRAIQMLLHVHRVLPGRRFAIVGSGSEAEEAGRDISLAGGHVAVQIDPRLNGADLTAEGDDGVEAVTVAGVRHEVDVVVIAAGRQPDAELALMAECGAGYAATLGGFIPLRDHDLRTSVPGILVAGDAAGIGDVATAIAEGRFAGVSAAAALGLVTDKELAAARIAYTRATGDRAAIAAALLPVPTHV